MHRSFRTGFLFLLVLLPFNAQAAVVEFEYEATVDFDFGISGVDVGDQVLLKILADNGTGLRLNPSYKTEDLISGFLTVGDYWQSYEDGWFNTPTHEVFTVLGNGSFVISGFLGTTESPNHKDVYGEGPSIRLLNGAVRDFNGNEAWFDVNLVGLNSIAAWSVTDIPLPMTLQLVALGLFMLAVSRFQQLER